jgi:hypothetical protein
MPPRIVRVGRVAVLAGALVSAAIPAQAATPSSSPGSDPPSVPASSTAPAQPSVPHDAPRLEALLPTEVDGAALFRTSFGPATWAGIGVENLGALGALTDELDVDMDAVSFAAANDPTASPLFNLFALAVDGVPGTTLNEVYALLAQQEQVGSTVEPATLGGIAVLHLDAPNNPIPHVWTWSVGDVVLGIQAADEETATRLITLLPTSVPAPEPVASASAAP